MKKTAYFNLPKFTLLVLSCATLAAAPAKAQTLVVANLATPDSSIIQTQSGEPRTYEDRGDLGFVFQVGSKNLFLTNLGLYAPSTGLAGSTAVNVYQLPSNTLGSGGTLVASATVGAGTKPDSQGFAYATLPTVALLQANDYYVIDYVDSSVDSFYDAQFSSSSSSANLSKLFDTSAITPLAVSLNGTSANPGYPTNEAGYAFYIGPNAKFQGTVPEPSSPALLFAGALAMLALAGRRRRLRGV